MVLTNFKHQESAFYALLFNKSEEGPFEVPPCRTKVGVIRKSVPGDPKLYVLHDSNSDCVICSLLSEFFFVVKKVQQIILKMIF